MKKEQQDALARSLDTALAAHSALLETAEMKRAALVALDMDAVRAVTVREERLVDEIRDNEEERRALLIAAAGYEPASGEVVRLREVHDMLAPDVLEHVRQLRAELVKIAGRLRRVNAINKALSEQMLAHIHGFLGLIAGATSKREGYGMPGAPGAKGTSIPLVVDRKI